MVGVLKREYTTKRTPSNLASPPEVPIHRYPSGVWEMARMRFSGSPSCVRQTCLAYAGTGGPEAGGEVPPAAAAPVIVIAMCTAHMTVPVKDVRKWSHRINTWRYRAF